MLTGPRIDRTVRAAVLGAVDEAARRRDPRVGTEHLLLGLLGVDGPVHAVLREAGLDAASVRDALDDVDRAALAAVGVDATHPSYASAASARSFGRTRRRRSRPPLSGATRAVLRSAVGIAHDLGDRRVTAEHLLLAAAGARRGGDPVSGVFDRLGVNPYELGARVAESLQRRRQTP
jgi:ATP-dependent Clp protease ATP-binding subunit ClpA